MFLISISISNIFHLRIKNKWKNNSIWNIHFLEHISVYIYKWFYEQQHKLSNIEIVLGKKSYVWLFSSTKVVVRIKMVIERRNKDKKAHTHTQIKRASKENDNNNNNDLHIK